MLFMDRFLFVIVLIQLVSACSDNQFIGGKSKDAAGSNTPAKNPVTTTSPSIPSATAAPASDEFQPRLDQAGAKTGVIQVSLIWNDTSDIDLHIVTPSGDHIFFANDRDRSGGFLDVDMNAGVMSSSPVENVFWTASALRGRYRVYVHYYEPNGNPRHETFKVRVKVGDQVKFYNGAVDYVGDNFSDDVPKSAVLVNEFNY